MKILLFTFILFLCAGIVSAADNSTVNDNIKDIIDNCEDDTISLEEKTYYLNPESETHIQLNKSITVEGSGQTVIDGKNTTLYLDVFEEDKNTSEDDIIIVRPAFIFDIKNNGSHITFKNITFKDLNIISRHEMEFVDCKFIKTNFTSKELNNTFSNCVFNQSKIELYVYDMSYNYYSKIANCTLYSSTVTSNVNIVIQLVGSSRVFIHNGLNLTDSNIINSKISLSHYNINIRNSKFNNSDLRGYSDTVTIKNATLNSPTVDFDYTDLNVYDATLDNCELKFHAGYYTKGCNVLLKDTAVNNATISFRSEMGSRPSGLTIKNSSVDKCEIKADDTNVKVNDSTFNKSHIELFYSNLNITNSQFYSDGDISSVIKTKTETEPYDKYHYHQVNTTYTVENSYLINGSGKYKISNNDININTFFKITYKKGNYYLHENITFNVKDHNGKPVSNLTLFIENPNDDFTVMITTDENGNANYTLEHIGKLDLNLYYYSQGHSLWNQRTSLQVNLTVYPKIIDLILIKDFKFNKYSKINSFLTAQIFSTNGDDLTGFKLIFKLYSGNKYKTYYRTVNTNGAVIFKIPAKLDAGVHKIEVIADTIMKKTSIKINKASTTVKAPKVTGKFKKSKYFKVTIKNKETKKLLSNVKVKIKVFTGKKYNTYTVKTDKKGLAKININKLKTGKHKVIISSGNNNYKISAKSLITIKA